MQQVSKAESSVCERVSTYNIVLEQSQIRSHISSHFDMLAARYVQNNFHSNHNNNARANDVEKNDDSNSGVNYDQYYDKDVFRCMVRYDFLDERTIWPHLSFEVSADRIVSYIVIRFVLFFFVPESPFGVRVCWRFDTSHDARSCCHRCIARQKINCPMSL